MFLNDPFRNFLPVYDAEDGGAGGTGGTDDKTKTTVPADDKTKTTAPADDKTKTTTTTEDWRARIAAGVPEDQREKFLESLKKQDSEAAFGAELHSLRKGINAKISIPDDKATDEQKAEFAEKLGWPKDGKYEYKPPEHAEEWAPAEELTATQEDFFKFANEVKMPKGMAHATMDKFFQVLEASTAELKANAEKANKETDAALTKEYGADKDANLAFAKTYLLDFADPEVAEDLMSLELRDGRRIGDLLPVVRAFVHAGRALKSEGDLRGSHLPENAKADLKTQIEEIELKASNEGTLYTEAVQAKLRPLYVKLHGTAPADGRK